jgi:AraC family transcriptional regulator, transcriptional activator of pobA
MWMSESAETAHFYNMYCSFEVFGLHVSTVEPGWSFPAGQHNLFELKLMLTGAQLTQIGEHAYLQNPGDLLIINPDEVHQSHAHGAEPSTSVVFHFNLDMPLFRETLIRNNQVLYPAGSRLSEKIRTRVDALKDMVLQDGNRIRMMAELMDAMAVLSEEFEQDQVRIGPVTPDTLRLAHRIAEKMQATLRDTRSGTIVRNCVEEAAKLACVSQSHCNRVFHQVYGVSPRQYLSSMRLNEAKKRLLCPDLHIEAISQELGYASVSEFSRQFKRWTGSCPSSFRVESRRTY